MGYWITDLKDGEACQIVVASYLQSLGLLHEDVKQSQGYEPGHDILTADGKKIEIKFDILGTLTNNLAIEFQRRKRDKNGEIFKEDTGIRVSQSDYWIVMYIEDKGDFMKTWDLSQIAPKLFIIKKTDLYNYVHTNRLKIAPMGDNKLTDGYILPIKDLINQPWCETIEIPLSVSNMDDLIYRLINKLKNVNENLLRKFGKLY